MKKFFSFILILVMIFSMAACGDVEGNGNKISDAFGMDYADVGSTVPSDISTAEESMPDMTEEESEKDNTDNGDLDPDFKAAMDSYEKFMDEYVVFMKKYCENPNDLSLLADYLKYTSDYSDFVEDFVKWGDEELNTAETAYYIDVQARVNKKLLEVTYN